jgi:hypothetical protein
MTAHWIEVKDGNWKLRSEVVAFKGLSGEHSGGNLGRYFVGLCERVGIITQNQSKVRGHLLFSNLCSLSVTAYCYLLLFFLIFCTDGRTNR